MKKCIITITDSISPTSMPFNEFVLYRNTKYDDEIHKMIIFFEKEVDKDVDYPMDVDIYRCGININKINKVVRDIVKYCEEESIEYLFHIHEGKSVILFNIATLFKYRKKIVYTVHSTYKNYVFHNKLFARIATVMCKNVVCVSKTSYKYFPKDLKFLYKKKILYIQNGVDVDRVNASLDKYSSEYFREKGKLRLIYVARLIPLKRHEIILDVISKLDFTDLTLIGVGEEEEKLKSIVKDYNMENRVHFLGGLPREKVFENIIKSDIYITTSLFEGLPISLLEAMCCGKCCLSSNIEQHSEVKEKCSSLILLNNKEEWIEKINELNKIEYNLIGNENKMFVDKYFSLQGMHINYTNLYMNILTK